MADKPIPFKPQMVRALLDGRKTQTRRIVDPIEPPLPLDAWQVASGGPYFRLRYAVGDRLWVREAWRAPKQWDSSPPRDLPPRSMTICFDAGGCIANHTGTDTVVRWSGDRLWPMPGALPDFAGKYRPPMFLPRWASRITLIVTDVRVERLQDISHDDVLSEGISTDDVSEVLGDKESFFIGHAYRRAFAALWESINGPGAWQQNPWVAAYTFTVEHRNIDSTERHHEAA